MDNRYGFTGDAYKTYRSLVKEHGRVRVHEIIDGCEKGPSAGLVLATWTLLTA